MTRATSNYNFASRRLARDALLTRWRRCCRILCARCCCARLALQNWLHAPPQWWWAALANISHGRGRGVCGDTLPPTCTRFARAGTATSRARAPRARAWLRIRTPGLHHRHLCLTAASLSSHSWGTTTLGGTDGAVALTSGAPRCRLPRQMAARATTYQVVVKTLPGGNDRHERPGMALPRQALPCLAAGLPPSAHALPPTAMSMGGGPLDSPPPLPLSRLMPGLPLNKQASARAHFRPSLWH